MHDLAEYMYAGGIDLEYRPNKFEIVDGGPFATYLSKFGAAETESFDIEVDKDADNVIIYIGDGLNKTASTVEQNLLDMFSKPAKTSKLSKPRKLGLRTKKSRRKRGAAEALDKVLDSCPVDSSDESMSSGESAESDESSDDEFDAVHVADTASGANAVNTTDYFRANALDDFQLAQGISHVGERPRIDHARHDLSEDMI